MAAVRVMLELSYTAERHDAFAGLSMPAGAPRSAGVVPQLPGLTPDENFTPVEVPVLVPADGVPQPRDVTLRLALDVAPEHSTYIVRGTVDEDDIESLQAACDQDPQVVGLFSDPRVQPQLICPGDPPKGTDSDVEKLLCVPALKKCGLDGSGVLVAVVDTGINLDYLRSRGKQPSFDETRSWVPQPGLVPGQLPVDHGTMVAYDVCIAAPNCTLLDIALLQSRREGGSIMEGFLSDAVLAYRHLLDVMQAEQRPGECRSLVVNNSWGMFHPSWDFPEGHPGNYSDNANHPFNRIVGSLETAGADILFAAGNCGKDCPDGRCQNQTTNAIYGANGHPQVLSIAGVDVTKARVGYSTIGPGRLARQKPDLSGYTHFKGSGVYAADGGTSAATPVVAGVVAALRTGTPYNPAVPETSPAAIRNLLIKTSEDAGAVGYDFEYGWGIISGCRIAEMCLDRETPKPGPERCKCGKCCCCCCGCGGAATADLVPVSRSGFPGPNGFCDRDERGRLVVTVRNQGAGHAAASTTRVVFETGDSVEIPTPALGQGDTVTLPGIDFPSGCFNSDCDFRIIVDARGDVSESDEANNIVSGRCIG